MACIGVSEATAALKAADTKVTAEGSLSLTSATAFDVTIALISAACKLRSWAAATEVAAVLVWGVGRVRAFARSNDVWILTVRRGPFDYTHS